MNDRVKQYQQISRYLAGLSHHTLEQMLDDAVSPSLSIGGASHSMLVDGVQVFVKKIPLSPFEQLPAQYLSTQNYYHLPLFYQYGVGSHGFGAWRELRAHEITSKWAISGECANFPILYHWRVLPKSPKEHENPVLEDMEGYCQYWDNSEAVRQRIQDIAQASAELVLFLEYIPENLYDWLSTEIAKGPTQAESAVQFVEAELQTINQYLKSQNFVHFDAHFKNILSDGKVLYLSDFGLALSSTFDLSCEEVAFLKKHKQYDEACAAVNLLHCIITTYYGKQNWEQKLRAYTNGELGILPSAIESTVKKYERLALIMDAFFQKLQKKSKFTPFPKDRVSTL